MGRARREKKGRPIRVHRARLGQTGHRAAEAWAISHGEGRASYPSGGCRRRQAYIRARLRRRPGMAGQARRLLRPARISLRQPVPTPRSAHAGGSGRAVLSSAGISRAVALTAGSVPAQASRGRSMELFAATTFRPGLGGDASPSTVCPTVGVPRTSAASIPAAPLRPLPASPHCRRF